MTAEFGESELTLLVKRRAISEEPYEIKANAEERAALAKRFGLSEVKSLKATLKLTPDGSTINADGTFSGHWIQPCAVAGEDFPVRLDEPLHFRFVQAREEVPDEEIELEADDLDTIDYDGEIFDLGEAVAQSLGLAIDPFATGPDADTARKETGILAEGEQDGPMAEMLAALKKS
ncbi:hypothetical protein GCM10023115_55870 [Pontixanthobacter gangjinensis]|uniref:DUF177 domain-containing protein n=1 Tax=Pontixanthobacter gangjinensis TaxID=1028742 RepID=A0A6I4SRX8_9SPHN|nr:DUF177 domain-containing protein [Pontixanthobacter gangjinensis]MXO57870.1 DUF177 domain-containing protein [Pontixanthobacter gangjinensis]